MGPVADSGPLPTRPGRLRAISPYDQPVPLAYFPSPPTGVLHLGPIPLRAYAFFIIIGVLVAVWLGDKRWVARGGTHGTIADVAVVAVPSGIVGARIYHVITDIELYRNDPVRALFIWEGGLGIWGAVAGGALGAWLYCRSRGIAFAALGDAIAPGIVLAQAIGRIGNYFNQELFGKPTTLPWGLTISPDNPNAIAGAEAYHPTFLYELLWDVGVAGLVLWADRRFRLGRGRAFALYVAAYCAGRLWIELLRVDPANTFLGLRLNVFTSVIVGLLALAYVVLRRGPRETQVEGLNRDHDGDQDDVGLSHRDGGSAHRDGGSAHRDGGSAHRDGGSGAD